MASRLLVVVFGVSLLIGAAAPALAQDEPTAGLFSAFPGSVGVLWRATDLIDVRPEVSFDWHEFVSSGFGLSINGVLVSSSETRTSNRAIGAGFSVLLTVAHWDRLRVYVTPRFQYTWLSSTSEEFDTTPVGRSASPFGPAADLEARATRTGRSYSAAGGSGARYLLGDRFGVFGETGVEFSSDRQPGSFSTFRAKRVSLRSNVGVILWF